MGDRVTNRSALVITLYGLAAWQFALAVTDAAEVVDYKLGLIRLYSAGYYGVQMLAHLAVTLLFLLAAKPLAAMLFRDSDVIDAAADTRES